MPRTKKERPGLILYHDMAVNTFDELSNEEAGMLIKALIHFSAFGEEPEPFAERVITIAYKLFRDKIIRDDNKYHEISIARSEAAKKSHNKNRAEKEDPAIEDDTEEVYSADDVGECDEDEIQACQTDRGDYGEYGNVHLNDAEMAILQREYPYDWEHLIEELDTWMQSKGKQGVYRDHLAALRSFAARQDIEPYE